MAQLKEILPFVLASLVILASSPASEARDFLVGGKENAWKIPSFPSAFNQWAASNRFQVGDVLTWKYDRNADSVLEVTMDDYDRCNTSKPLKEYRDGDTNFKFDRSGPFYFISGAEGHCQKGQKLIVVVMSPRHRSMGKPGSAPWYPPAPSPHHGGAASLCGGGFWRIVLTGLAVLGMMVVS